MKIKLTLLILFLSLFSFAQKIDKSVFLKMLKEVVDNYSVEAYELNFEQFIYADSLRNNLQNQQNTKMIKVSNYAYQIESKNTFVINQGGVKLVIDSVNNEMFILKGDTANVTLWTFEEPQFDYATFHQFIKGKEKIYRVYINYPGFEILYIEYKLNGKNLVEMNIQYKSDNYMDLEYEEIASVESPFIRTIFGLPKYNFDKSTIIKLEQIVKKNAADKFELTDPSSSFSLHDLRYEKN